MFLKKLFDVFAKRYYYKFLQLVTPNLFISNRVRLGRQNDGGYIVVGEGFKQYDVLLSFGISNDISFEKDFQKAYPKCDIYCFDPTVDSLPENLPNSKFFKKGIASKSYDNYLTLADIQKLINIEFSNKNVFLKMDIEGFEWEVFYDKKSYELIKLIDQIAIELHFKYIVKGNKYYLPYLLFERYSTLKKIRENFDVFNLHANNATESNSYSRFKSFIFPHVVEVSLLNKLSVKSLVPNLNQSCNPLFEDIQEFYL
jgi:hypothetical protein